MGKDWEERLHQEIEASSQASRQAAWEKLKARLEADGWEGIPAQAPVPPPRKRRASWRRVAGICASAAALVIVAVCVCISFLSKPVETGDRFCTQEEYYFQAAERTLEQYAASIEKDLLYFDWYEGTAYRETMAYRLKDTEEIICYREEMFHPETFAMVTLQVTDNRTKLDILNTYESECKETAIIVENKIFLGLGNEKSRAYWEYNGYRYYLDVSEAPDENYILTLIEELLTA